MESSLTPCKLILQGTDMELLDTYDFLLQYYISTATTALTSTVCKIL